MTEKEKPIAFTYDIDGILREAPIPLTTLWSLVRRSWKLREQGSNNPNYYPGLFASLSIKYHRGRSLNWGAIESIDLFKSVAEIHERSSRFFVVSGREKDKHELTTAEFQKDGLLDLFEGFLLNQGASSSLWKEDQVTKLAHSGTKVVHFEDDLKPALCVSRVNHEFDDPMVLVYLKRNITIIPIF